MGISPKVVKDDNIRTLLDRRAEILEQINKLEREYSALGNILRENYDLKQENAHLKQEVKYYEDQEKEI